MRVVEGDFYQLGIKLFYYHHLKRSRVLSIYVPWFIFVFQF